MRMGSSIDRPRAAMPRAEISRTRIPGAVPDPALMAFRGRGAVHSPPPRFDRLHHDPFDDGWATLDTLRAAPRQPPTTLTPDRARSALTYNDSPDLGFDRSINPYRGCEHGCIYCYARPTHAYLGLSPGLDFETRLSFKPGLAALLERELRQPAYACRPVALGTNTDPYQPVERTLGLTRSVLELLLRFEHPCTIVTKSAGVLRDLDLLAELARRNLVRVYLSVTTLDPRLARVMEPRAATPERRLAAIAGLAEAGIPVGTLVAPIIPGLTDAEIEPILAASRAAGASFAGGIMLRLPGEVADLFQSWLATHFPDRAGRVLALIRDTRADRLNDPAFHSRFRGTGPYAGLLHQRLVKASRRLGFTEAPALDTTRFAVPRTPDPQLRLGF